MKTAVATTTPEVLVLKAAEWEVAPIDSVGELGVEEGAPIDSVEASGAFPAAQR